MRIMGIIMMIVMRMMMVIMMMMMMIVNCDYSHLHWITLNNLMMMMMIVNFDYSHLHRITLDQTDRSCLLIHTVLFQRQAVPTPHGYGPDKLFGVYWHPTRKFLSFGLKLWMRSVLISLHIESQSCIVQEPGLMTLNQRDANNFQMLE